MIHHFLKDIKLDKTPPEINMVYPHSEEIADTQPTIQIAYSDSLSGVDTSTIIFKINQQPITAFEIEPGQIVYTPEEPLEDNQGYNLQISLSDRAGNSSTTVFLFNIKDLTPPVTSATFDSERWYDQDITIVLTATDAGSGIKDTYYKINDGPIQSVTENGQPTITEESNNNKIEFWSVDTTGNEEMHQVIENIKLDKTPSVTSTNFDPNPYYYEDVTINLTAIDNVSGVAETYYRINNGPRRSVSADGQPKITEESDRNTLEFWSIDNAGNTEEHHIIAGIKMFRAPADERVGGRRVGLFDGKVLIDIPQDTYEGLSAEQRSEMRVQLLETKPFEEKLPGYSVNTVIKFLPEKLEFNPPITVSIREHEVPGTPLELRYYNESTGIMEDKGELIVDSQGMVSFQVSHFSTYAIIKNLTPQYTPIGTNTIVPLPDLLTGAFSHSIPITVPPGRKGMQPNLTLQYRTTNPNSWVGMGWSLNPGYLIRDTRQGPPNYNDSDTFIFRTQSSSTELVHLTDNVWQAEIESTFTRFYKEGDTWRTVEKNGTIMEFGTTPESKEQGSGGTFAWYVTKVKDTNGNYARFNYEKSKGKSYLNSIEYTGNEKTGFEPRHRVEFITEGRNDIISSFISGEEISIDRRLKTIKVWIDKTSGEELVWRYELNYEQSPDTSRSLLKSVTQYGSDGKNFPTLTFTYQRSTEN